MHGAARHKDGHTCKFTRPEDAKAHVGGPLTTGTREVLVNHEEAAIFGDEADCAGIGSPAPRDSVVGGNLMVFIGGQPAARKGEVTFGGNVDVGSPDVLHNASVEALSEAAASWLHAFMAQQAHIPFSFAWDGCYARAHEMRRLMAENFGIRMGSIRKIFIEGNLMPDTGAVHTNPGKPSPDLGALPDAVRWDWHVAPAVRGIDGREWIIDPSLSPVSVLTREEWMRLSAGKKGYISEWYYGSAESYTRNTNSDPTYEHTRRTLEGYSHDKNNGNYVESSVPSGVSTKDVMAPPLVRTPHVP